MTDVVLLNPPDMAPAIGFSHVSVTHGLVYVAGQIACDRHGKVKHPGDLASQFTTALDNVRQALWAAGSAPQLVIKLTYFVTDMTAYRKSRESIGQGYREVFGKHFPPATLVEVSALYEPEALVEIECVAAQAQGEGGE